jgi:hypothetical protein
LRRSELRIIKPEFNHQRVNNCHFSLEALYSSTAAISTKSYAS